ncbi:MAG: type IX secretion system membrane protein PorP/SprF [Bacteroidota bacterium]
MRKLHILGALLLGLSSLLTAQNDIHYTMYMFNKLALNPAYAGSREALTMAAHYRNQWPGVTGAPKTYTLWAHTPFMNKRNGVGLSIVADEIGILNSYNIEGSYAYRIKMDKYKTFSVGLSGQLQYGRIHWDRADPLDVGDDFVPNAVSSKLNPNFGVGVYFMDRNYYVGASIPRILKTTVYADEPISSISLNAHRTYYLMGGFVTRLNSNVKLRPGILFAYNPHAPFEFDFNVSFVFIDRFLIGASYRLQDSFDAIAQFQATDQIKVGLGVDFTLTELSNYSPGSFEVMVEYSLIQTGLRLNNIRFF